VQFLKNIFFLESLGDLGVSPSHHGLPEFVIALCHSLKSLKTSKSWKISFSWFPSVLGHESCIMQFILASFVSFLTNLVFC
jgi:hypothetical protein